MAFTNFTQQQDYLSQFAQDLEPAEHQDFMQILNTRAELFTNTPDDSFLDKYKQVMQEKIDEGEELDAQNLQLMEAFKNPTEAMKTRFEQEMNGGFGSMSTPSITLDKLTQMKTDQWASGQMRVELVTMGQQNMRQQFL